MSCSSPHPLCVASGEVAARGNTNRLASSARYPGGLSESILSFGFFVRKMKAPMPPHTDVGGGAEFSKITSVYTAFDSNT